MRRQQFIEIGLEYGKRVRPSDHLGDPQNTGMVGIKGSK
jgi:hypothetical protein